jgi:prolipoprotein diacylglyceryltransferase
MYQHFSIGLTLAFALYSLGKVQEGSASALLTEFIKYGLLMLNLVWFTTAPQWLSLTTLTIGLFSLIWLYTIHKQNSEMQTV